MRYIMYGTEFLLLFVGLALLLGRMRWLELAAGLMRRGKEGMDEAARRRLLENRRQLLTLQKEHSIWYRLEQELNYSGWKRRFPFLTAELWVAGNFLSAAVVFLILTAALGWRKALAGVAAGLILEYMVLCICKARAFRSVNTNLIKFLDFLGNYSITAGEITGIFKQISKYVDEPLQTVLDECSYEAQTTGDSSLALLVMAEKIEHPKFKELARNMEISIRYCADFTALVNSSRRNMREYLRMREEQKSLMRESAINMALLLIMSAATLMVVDGLIEVSVWIILFMTWPGRAAVGIVGFILLLFAGKIYGLNH